HTISTMCSILHALLSHFFLYRSSYHRDLPSFPTRRSSDLPVHFGPRREPRREPAARRDTGRGIRRLPATQYSGRGPHRSAGQHRSEEHTSELQSRFDLVCRLLLEKKKTKKTKRQINRKDKT